jgi:endo-1,4-beta-xylanase
VKRALVLVLIPVILFVVLSIPGMMAQPQASQASTTAPTTPSIGTAAGTEGAPTLRSLAEKRNFYVGAAVAYAPFLSEKPYRDTLRTQYNMVVAENVMKWDTTEPLQDSFNFDKADAIVQFAQDNHMVVRGHNLVWHNQIPGWVTSGNFTRDQLLSVMQNHIQNEVAHFKGKVVAWDVVNEGMGDDGQLRKDIWLDTIGPDYIEQAFRFAHQADPDAKLYYNDYGGEGMNHKSDAIYAMVSDLKKKGVPIDGVGLQMHVGIGPGEASSAADVAANMERLGALGLDVQITEMDVKIENGTGSQDENLKAQAALYGTMLQVCLQHKNCTAFLTWGFTDNYTWIPGFTGKDDLPLPFDMNYLPKPAYGAMIDVLNAATSAS